MGAPCCADPLPRLALAWRKAPRQGGGAEDTGGLPGEFAEPHLHGFLGNPVICTSVKD